MKPTQRTSRTNTEPLLREAREWVGYTTTAAFDSEFGARTGHRGVTWTGSFIDVCARGAGLTLPAHADSTGALAVYLRSNALYKKPRPGDVVFFAYGPANYTAPRTGIVSDVRGWRKFRTFKVIEGQTASGLPRGGDTPNGVYERVHHSTDVLAFARPGKLKTIFRVKTPYDTMPLLHPSALKSGGAVIVLQLALAAVTDLQGAERGKFDGATKSAYRDWQRQCGMGSAANGTPDANSLKILSERTGLFAV